MRSSGNRVRVTAQLVNAADGYQLWSERYDREMRDVLDIQDEISHAIVDTSGYILPETYPLSGATPQSRSIFAVPARAPLPGEAHSGGLLQGQAMLRTGACGRSKIYIGLPWPGRVLLAERILRLPVSKGGDGRRKGSGGPCAGNRRCAPRGACAAGHDAGHCRLRLAGCRSGLPARFGIGCEFPLRAFPLCKFLFVASRAG